MKYLICLFVLSLGISLHAQNILTAEQAAQKTGEAVTLTGTVVEVFPAVPNPGQPLYVNIDRPYPFNPIVITIHPTSVKTFDIYKYLEKEVLISGTVGWYNSESMERNLPRIQINNSSQIQLANPLPDGVEMAMKNLNEK